MDSWQVFTTVGLPGAMPWVMAGVNLAVGLILIAISEMIGAKEGIG
jgi:ABC-type nitrate/sulfonate/bicarbonate transport system permease component